MKPFVVPLSLDAAAGHLDAVLADVVELVRVESPSGDLVALKASADAVARVLLRRLGVEPERLEVDDVPHLRVRFGSGPRTLVLLAHHDTVWPLGTLARLPCAVTDGVLRGPGCFDMILGLVAAVHALAAVHAQDPALLEGVSLLVTGDEEIGSPSSRGLIEAEAAGARAALVLEASADGGALKTGRKGVSLYTLEVTGRAAHAGLEPERGANAAVAAAHVVLALAALGRADLGTTVTPTVVHAGTTTNTVPAAATVSVDVRASSAVEQQRVDAAVRALAPGVEGCAILVRGGVNRPPLEESSSASLLARAQEVADALGLPPWTTAAVGGASDGNFTAGIGVPTLDGLGAVGGGAHADHEHVLVSHVPERLALVAGLVAHVQADTG